MSAKTVVGLDLIHPSENLKPDVMKFLVDPSNVGHAHIKELLVHPEYYHVNKHLVQQFLMAYYHILWDQTDPLYNRLHLEVLSGARNPSKLSPPLAMGSLHYLPREPRHTIC